MPLCMLRARAIGVITMRDDKGQDDKIIAVHVDDPEYAHYRDIAELPPHRLKEMQRFFLDYKVLEDKAVDVDHIRGRVDAEQRDPGRRPAVPDEDPAQPPLAAPRAGVRLGWTVGSPFRAGMRPS